MIPVNKSRRAFLGTGVAAVAAAQVSRGAASGAGETFVDIIRPPDFVAAYGEGSGRQTLSLSSGRWQSQDVEFTVEPRQFVAGRSLAMAVTAPHSLLQRLQVRWLGRFPQDSRFLGDQWERSYGDLEWRGFDADRVMPWYFLAATGRGTHGYGVKTGARALCFWQVDAEGVSLWLDVRNGGSGVQLGDRRLDAAEVVALRGPADESPYRSARALCRALAAHPRLPQKPVYGSNNWYYLYGENMTAESVLRDVEQLAELAPVAVNAPFMVVDMGWGKARGGAGPWTEDNASFPEVPSLPGKMKKLGVRPGIWVRPLVSVDPQARQWEFVGTRKIQPPDSPFVIDPSLPEVLAYLQEGLQRVTGWGYELVKHDFSTFDMLGRWGLTMGAEVTSEGWHFADRSRTTAEVIAQFYRALRQGVGNALLLGCNTVGHLGAGIFELQRTGDDTSGRDWNRTRKMGVNTLGFRLAQNRSFFVVDPDCAPVAKALPAGMTRQWLDLVARSGAALFISADPAQVTPEDKRMLSAALRTAALSQPDAEPLDWMDTTSPERWRFGAKASSFAWFGKEGVDFFPA